MRLAGERAIVTGSTSGIGREIASVFAAEGAAVVVTGRDAERGHAAVEQIARAGGHGVFLPADLSDPGAPGALVERAVQELGGLSVLVNNAVAGDVDLGDAAVGALDDGAWDRTLRVNLWAPMALTRAALPHLIRAGGGSIVNVSSRAAERASRGLAAYIASKGGLNALTRSIAVDYAAEGIRCNTISPGYVWNERRDARLTDERRAHLEAMHLTRLGTARDVALAALYLASRESEWCTGQNLVLDGGGSIARGRVRS